MKYPFTQDEAATAFDAWGCNCGPAALAFALQVTLDDVRPHIPHFDERRYTSPTMMRAALAALGRTVIECRAPQSRDMFHELPALVRVQWTGPWTEPVPRKWAARYTHWIVCWRLQPPVTAGTSFWVFDVNRGICSSDEWMAVVVKRLTQHITNADGGWYPVNIWRLEPVEARRVTGSSSLIFPETRAIASDPKHAAVAAKTTQGGEPCDRC